MNSPINPIQFVTSIKKLASEAAESLAPSSPSYKEALTRIIRPVDYMRCAEFVLAFEQVSLKPNMRVLDIGSPQWFSLHLAHSYPKTQFYYVNILDRELDQTREIAQCLDIDNISYHKQDVRSLEFDSHYFDKAISISVLEHVAPDIGGDILALNEIRRVLISRGELIFSVPLKKTPNRVYQDGAVYERGEKEHNFFAREYDLEQFQNLVRDTGFLIKEKSFIIEQPGLFALDFWLWGPGKNMGYKYLMMKLIKVIERILRTSVEDKLAVLYLRSSPEVQYRVVNVVATIEKLEHGVESSIES